jgi:ankyrin repeat protein
VVQSFSGDKPTAVDQLRPLVRAALRGELAAFEQALHEALEQKIDIRTAENADRWNLLHRALVSVMQMPNPQIIRRIIEAGVDVNARDRNGYTPLHFAARSKATLAIAVLLDANAEIDPVDDKGLTPLRHTLLKKPYSREATELLLERGANKLARPPDGASVEEYVKIIAHGADAWLLELFARH